MMFDASEARLGREAVAHGIVMIRIPNNIDQEAHDAL